MLDRRIGSYAFGLLLVGASCFVAGRFRPNEPGVPAALQMCDMAKLRQNLKSDQGFIEFLYCFALQRPADRSGVRSWLSILADNPNRGAAFLAFVTSQEFKNTVYRGRQISSLSDADFILFAYDRLLSRAATVEEKRYWEKKNEDGTFSRESMLKELIALPVVQQLYSLGPPTGRNS